MEKIIIKGLECLARHGVNPEEKIEKQVFIIDCKMYIRGKTLFLLDKLDKTINYAGACKNIKSTVEENNFNLVERLAEEISKNLFANFNSMSKLKLAVKKPNAPINFAKFRYVGVKISRKREDYDV